MFVIAFGHLLYIYAHTQSIDATIYKSMHAYLPISFSNGENKTDKCRLGLICITQQQRVGDDGGSGNDKQQQQQL